MSELDEEKAKVIRSAGKCSAAECHDLATLTVTIDGKEAKMCDMHVLAARKAGLIVIVLDVRTVWM